ncbi:MAG: hypothetical protein Q9176_003939 [Flavoplaca citrina]
MILPLSIPTTSPLAYPAHLTSPSHPSLPLTTQTQHAVLRSALKAYAHAPTTQKTSHFTAIVSALNNYIPYLFAIAASLDGKPVNGEEVDVVLKQEVECEWKSILATTSAVAWPKKSGRGKKGRVTFRGVDAEVVMVMTTLATAHRLIAREQLRGIFTAGNAFPEPEARTKVIAGAMRGLLDANGIHSYLVHSCASMMGGGTGGDGKGIQPPELCPGVHNGLAEIAMSEATLLAVLKDDPYPAIVMQTRDKSDKEWMVKAPDIPKVRVHLFARLCIAAGEHAGIAEALFLSSHVASKAMKVDEEIVDYSRNLKRTARAKACRFFGIDQELSGETGKAIAWLRAARKEVEPVAIGSQDGKGWVKGWGKVKKSFEEKREDRRIEKGGEWGSNAGRIEEGRVVEMLERKWTKMNDTMNTQLIPPFEPLLASMPSGREIHSSTQYKAPELDVDMIERMRAPPDVDEAGALARDDDSSEDEADIDGLPGAFPCGVASLSAAQEYY